MDFLEHYLGEDVWPIIGLLALVALGLGIAVVATGRGRLLIGIVALACLAIVLLGIEHLWVTDRERVDGIINEMAQSAVREDSAGIVRHLSAHCRYGNLDRTGIERLASSTFARIEIDKVNVSSRKTEVFPMRGEARVDFLAVVRGRQNNVDFSPYPTRWIFTFVQSPEGAWEVEEIQQIPAFSESRQPITLPPQLP
jgi:hypothetical protein